MPTEFPQWQGDLTGTPDDTQSENPNASEQEGQENLSEQKGYCPPIRPDENTTPYDKHKPRGITTRKS